MSQKTIIALAVAAALTLPLSGCGKAPETATPQAQAEAEAVVLKSGIELGNLEPEQVVNQEPIENEII